MVYRFRPENGAYPVIIILSPFVTPKRGDGYGHLMRNIVTLWGLEKVSVGNVNVYILLSTPIQKEDVIRKWGVSIPILWPAVSMDKVEINW
jgi:hypothetical protein